MVLRLTKLMCSVVAHQKLPLSDALRRMMIDMKFLNVVPVFYKAYTVFIKKNKESEKTNSQ